MSRFVEPAYIPQDSKDKSLPKGLLYFYEPESLTPKETFADSELTNPNSHPMVADGAGIFTDIYLAQGGYRVILRDKNDNLIYDRDNVESIEDVLTQVNLVTFDSVADMIASDLLEPGNRAETSGYYDDGTGLGAAKYFIVSPGTITPDEFGDFTLANGNIAQLVRGDARLNIHKYGVVPDSDESGTDNFKAMLLSESSSFAAPDGVYTFSE